MKMLRIKLLIGNVIWLMLAVVKNGHGYSSGAPVHVCSSMYPGHGVDAQQIESPYTINALPSNDDESKVKIVLIGPPKEEFTGFLLQGRPSSADNKTIGAFINVPADAKTIDCYGNKGSAVTQINNSKRNSLELDWQASPDYDGYVTFLATIVKNKSTFWVKLESEPVRVKRSAEEEKRPSVGISTTFPPASAALTEIYKAEQDIYSGCGKTKNCVAIPEGCVAAKNCTAAVAVIPSGNKYQFDMIAKNRIYASFGFSEDALMGGDNCIDCVNNNSRIEAYRSWNLPFKKKNVREDVPQTGFSLIKGLIADGYIYCRVIHDAVSEVHNINFDLDKNPYYILLAAGNSLKVGRVGHHDIARSSGDARKLSDLRGPSKKDPIYDECNIYKNCFGYPDGCIDDQSCTALATVKAEGGRYTFELKGTTSGYVALGLSDDKTMGGDSVTECVYDTNTPSNPVKVFMSWNKPGVKANTRARVKQTAVNLISGSYEDGVVYCKFNRESRTIVEGKTFDLVNDKYYLFLASGSSVNADGVEYHDLFSSSSGQVKALADIGEFGAASKLYIRLHGAFMIAAWIGFASLGVVLARYFKQTWTSVTHCGKDVWFAWHRFFMLLTWLLTISGHILIFIEIGGWVQGSKSQTHAIFGCVASALCFIQPFMAALRPHPSARKRPLFNWIHWLVGNTAHIIAIVTIFFAVQLKKAELPDWMDWILVGFVAFYVVVHLVLSISGCLSERQSSKRINTFPMKDMHSRTPINHMDRKMDSMHTGFRKFIFVVHFLVIAAFTTALILLVVLAPIGRQWTSLQNKINSM